MRLEPVLGNKRGHDSERPVQRDEEWPPLAETRESSSTETKTQHSNQPINQSLKKKRNINANFVRCDNSMVVCKNEKSSFGDANQGTSCEIA